MLCPSCGSPHAETDLRCPRCGSELIVGTRESALTAGATQLPQDLLVAERVQTATMADAANQAHSSLSARDVYAAGAQYSPATHARSPAVSSAQHTLRSRNVGKIVALVVGGLLLVAGSFLIVRYILLKSRKPATLAAARAAVD